MTRGYRKPAWVYIAAVLLIVFAYLPMILPFWAAAGGFTLAGTTAARTGRVWIDRVALGASGALAVALAIVLGSMTQTAGVPAGQFYAGIFMAMALFVAIPAAGYYIAGRRLYHRARWAPTAAWVISAAPLSVYFVLCGWFVAFLVACPPGAYECPV